MYRIVLRNSAKKFLEKLSRDHYLRFSHAFHALAHDPLKGDVKKLRGAISGAYRLRIGKWRALFIRMDDAKVIEIVIIKKRGDIY